MTLNKEPRREPTRFFETLTSLNDFDKIEIRNVIHGLLNPTPREICFTTNYYRAFTNVESILVLNDVKHIQAIASVTRGLFEIAIDVALINHIPQGPEKMLAHVDVERLRSAEKIIAFKASNPTSEVDSRIYEQFVRNESKRVIGLRDSLWPGRPDVQHWSLLKMQQRVEKLGSPFNELYVLEYPVLSWFIHSGLTGFANVQKDSLDDVVENAFTIAVKSYMALLGAVIVEFNLDKHDPDIKRRMQYAQMVPWTDSEHQAAQLRAELGLENAH